MGALRSAPFFGGGADGPDDGRAFWFDAIDGIRLRAAVWSAGAPKGTVLLLPGRTEYIEKYGPAAADLAARGFATLAIDWRGQGLAQRLLPDARVGHVNRFSDYQLDLDALLALASDLGVPQPYYLLSHSMGGCIALRALTRAIPVRAAVFSAPMWGLRLSALTRPIAWGLATLAPSLGQAHRYAPGTNASNYVETAAFEGNVLTTDRAMWQQMVTQITAHPELALGGPSLGWVGAALRECQALARMPAPNVPTVTFIGSAEQVVDPAPVLRRMKDWPSGRLITIEGAEHEVIIETAATRKLFFDTAADLFLAS